MDANPGGELVADVGGTNVRFGLTTREGGLAARRDMKCADHPSFAAAVGAYLEGVPGDRRPASAGVAIACPVSGDEVRMTNHVWTFSVAAIKRELGLERLLVLNDFEALALAIPRLPADACATIKPGEPRPGAPVAVMGPGTGLGTSALVFANGAQAALACEGGHQTLAPTTEREWAVYRVLQRAHGHVSAECVLSGPGLERLHAALADIDGAEHGRQLEAGEIGRLARDGADALATEALRLFSSWLGMVGGNLVLAIGARGGLVLGGGMLPKLGNAFDRAAFNASFIAKGRLSGYLEPVPVQMIVRPGVALLGVARALERYEGA